MLDWMLLPYKRYFDFSGRSRRMEFWSFQLLSTLVGMVFLGLAFAGGAGAAMMQSDETGFGGSAALSQGFGPLAYLGFGVYALFALGSIIPGIAVTVRRLHDRNLSGWLYLVMILISWIPLIGLIAALAFLVVMFLEGTRGPNRYGPDPKDPLSSDVFA